MKKIILVIVLLATGFIFSQIIPSNKTDTLFVDDFESGSLHWNLTGNWAVVEESEYQSATHSLTESPGGDYISDENTTATLLDTLDLSPYYDAIVSFWIKYDIESNFDYMYLEVSEDNGDTWENVDTWTGEDVSWFRYNVTLGFHVGQPEVNLRFRWESDSAIEESGTCIDDIMITGTRSVPPDHATFIYDDPPQFYEGIFGEFTDTVTVLSYYTLTDVEAKCSVDGVSQENIVANHLSGDEWEFTIPYTPYGALIEYTFFARDSVNNETTDGSVYKYISGTHRIYDSGIVSYYNTTENGDAKAVRISLPGLDSLETDPARLYTVLVRNYRNIDHLSDDMTVRVWADDGGKPGVELITPLDITPEGSLVNTMPFTVVDLRYLEGLIVHNSFWVGYSSEYGTVYGLQEAADETGETAYGRSYKGTRNGDGWDWEAETEQTNYHIRAIIEFPIMGIENQTIPATTSLEQNYPNPFNPVTTINFSISMDNSKVKLLAYNVNGQIVKTLFDGVKNTGKYNVTFDASALNSGVYYYSLEVDGVRQITKKNDNDKIDIKYWSKN